MVNNLIQSNQHILGILHVRVSYRIMSVFFALAIYRVVKVTCFYSEVVL
jgi:hypothetical protein